MYPQYWTPSIGGTYHLSGGVFFLSAAYEWVEQHSPNLRQRTPRIGVHIKKQAPIEGTFYILVSYYKQKTLKDISVSESC